MPSGQRGRPRLVGPIEAVRAARKAAAHALEALRTEIASVRARLEELVAEQKRFLADLFPTAGGVARGRGKPGRRPGRIERRAPMRRGPAKADRFFAKLPQRFTLDAVRKVAGRLSAVSLAQWSRSKKIAKTAAGYVKVGTGSPKKATRKAAAKTSKKRRRGAGRVQQKKLAAPTASAATKTVATKP
jgi:hypothetical protein